jgi:nucleotide-binding universal stress UspA family protein
MKSILVPTDFSSCADNAIRYAIELARYTNAKLILFNVYQSQVVPAEVPVVLPIEEIAADAMKALKVTVSNLQKKYNYKVRLECETAWGLPVEEIKLFAEKNKIDLIVMGAQGTGYIAERLIGSVTASLIRKAKCPVLSIDQHIKFKEIKKIVFACDYAETKNNEVLKPLKKIFQLFKAHIYILNVGSEMESTPAITKAVAGIKLDHSLEGFDHSFHFVENDNITEGIDDFVEKNKADLVVMIPRVHTTLKDLFSEPNTKRMSFHSKVPLLTMHE